MPDALSRHAPPPVGAPDLQGCLIRLDSRLSAEQLDALEEAVASAQPGTAARADLAPEAELPRIMRDLRTRGRYGLELGHGLDPSLGRALARLILDGLLEIHDAAGYTAGPSSLERLFGSPEALLATFGASPATALARRALEAVGTVTAGGPDIVAARLYMYGREPVTPAACRSLATPRHVLRLLDVDAESPRALRLARHWELRALPRAPDDWISWRAVEPPIRSRTDGLTYKLYVCPTQDAFHAVFERSADSFARHTASEFKIGSGAFALARPDKFVGYFAKRDDLIGCMEELEQILAGHPSNRLPFAAEESPSGLLAWGVDFAFESANEDQVSWRWWICERLARYLCHAVGRRCASARAVDYALLRLALDDVRIDTFAPSDRLLAEVSSFVRRSRNA